MHDAAASYAKLPRVLSVGFVGFVGCDSMPSLTRSLCRRAAARIQRDAKAADNARIEEITREGSSLGRGGHQSENI